MSLPVWKTVKLATVLVADAGWHYDDEATLRKLASSLQRHGQLEPLVVRGDLEDDSLCTLVRGHKLFGAMQALGWTEAQAVHVGLLDTAGATRVMLALELRHEVDYAELADRVYALVEAGATTAEIAGGSPFDQERIQHFLTLRSFDWKRLGEDDGQVALDWDAPAPDEAHALPVAAPPVPAVALAAAAPAAEDALQDVTEAQPLMHEETVGGVTLRTDDPGLLQQAPDPAGAASEATPTAGPRRKRVRSGPATTPAAQAPPADGAAPQPAAAEQGAATAGEAETTPPTATKAKPAKAAKVPKVPDAQLGFGFD